MTWEQAIESSTGYSMDTLRRATIWEMRERTEKKHGAPLAFVSEFPHIGRGNVLRDKLLSHAEVERMADEALASI